MSKDSTLPPDRLGAHPELLDWYVAGALDAGDSAEIAAHVDRCDECREAVRTMRSLAGTMQRYAGLRLPGAAASRWKARVAAAAGAAAVLALVVSAGIWLRDGPTPPRLWPVHTVRLTPGGRGAATTAELSGPGPWLLRIVLPFDAPPGRYEVTVELEEDSSAPDSTLTVEADREGALEMLLEVRVGGAYRVSVNPAGGQTAIGAPFHYRFLVTGSR
jgi:hypothetical protein